MRKIKRKVSYSTTLQGLVVPNHGKVATYSDGIVLKNAKCYCWGPAGSRDKQSSHIFFSLWTFVRFTLEGGSRHKLCWLHDLSASEFRAATCKHHVKQKCM